MDERHLEREPELLRVREASWDASRSRSVLSAVHGRVRRARTLRNASVVLSVAAGVVAMVALWPREAQAPVASRAPHEAPAVEQPARASNAGESERTLRFADGSHVSLLDHASEVEVMHATAERVEVALTRGRGTFQVTPQPTRVFVVRVASLSIEVVGTTFTVVREAERVHVSVQEGRVEVSSPDEHRALIAGESAWFREPARERVEPAAAPHEARRGTRQSARERFLEHAHKRDYAQAMQAIRETPSVVRDTAEELMLAADAARLSGDAPAAVPFLTRVAEQHPRDSRAPLAAFTLGRIYLFDLHRPLEARKAFARTRKLSAQGALAEDALAREVEAAAQAGLAAEARALAREYLDAYPQGRRRAQVAPFAQAP